MIPVLFDSNETSFTTNGLGRLRDCTSCVVTEERNGIYECDFDYPVTGYNYNLIQVGRIVAVSHDDQGDIQPFDIVSFTKPLDGIVTFHCVHISYRQSFMTVHGENINSLADAFNLLSTSTPTNPFTYQTDMTKTGFLAAADGIPRSVRQMLGGMEGSILDTYGGEYEWDKWNVILHSDRGVRRPFAVRYGVNMLSYDDDLDASEAYSSVIPFWTNDEGPVIGPVVSATGATPANHQECIPLDLTDKFETRPTAVQLQAEAEAYLEANSPYLPTQTIKVSFAHLNYISGNEDLANLERCELCDTIRVVFPDYNTNSYFKIVKTVWNVLENRYDEMELGTLQTTLSEALGISVSPSSTSAGITVETDPVFTDSPAYGITNADISNWNSKQAALVSGTNIKTINNQSLLGSGNITISGGTSTPEFIVATMTSNQTLSAANTTYTVNLNSQKAKSGSKLSFSTSSHAITIGAGVTAVEVDAQIYISTNGTNGAKNVYIYKDSTNMARGVRNLTASYNTINVHAIIPVEEGDTITMRALSGNGTTTVIAGDSVATLLTVKVLG